MNTAVIIIMGMFVALGFAWVELVVRGKEARKLRRRLDELGQRMDSTQQAQSGLQDACEQLQTRTHAAMEQLEQLRERQNQLDLRDPETGAYAQAIRQVRRGATVESLVADCGVTPAEAELLRRLHGPKQAGNGS